MTGIVITGIICFTLLVYIILEYSEDVIGIIREIREGGN